VSQGPASIPSRFARAVDRIGHRLELVEGAMGEQLDSASALLGDIGQHVLGSGGKRIRPALLLWAAELCGESGPRSVQVAAAIELLHTATLLHDDVVDLSELRRGLPSANAIWGNRRAVLSGDFLYARASSMIVEDGDHDILWIFADTIRRMAEGELLQLGQSYDAAVTEAHYFSVIERKSAALLSAACEAGAILAGVTRGERRRLADFGREFGIAFQLRDDALDYESGEAKLGKPPHADIREGKVTLPLLLALKRCTPAEYAGVADLLKQAARQTEGVGAAAAAQALDLAPAIDLVARYRGVADTVRRAEEHAARAAAAIAPFRDGPAKEDLLAAASFAVRRDR
jgi:octaprenyl-diphosphate synthase